MNRSVHRAALTLCTLGGWLLAPQLACAHAQATTTVQFDREIVRILDDHCTMCHVEKGLAFPLITYEQVYAARWQIRQDALDGHMAPWPAVSGFGDFVNDNSLTQREIDFLSSWAESFGPRNNGTVYTAAAAAPVAPKIIQAHVDFERWALGKPDLLLKLTPNTLQPRESAFIRRVVIDPKLTADRWLRGFEYKPGDHRVVRAVSFSLQETGQWLGSWTPWFGFVNLPASLAYRLPAGSHIVAEIHYSGTRETVVDQGSLGLYFSVSPSARAVSDLVLESSAPPGAGAMKISAARTLDRDLSVVAVQPQIAPGVQSLELSAKRPDGTRQVLLFAKDIPSQWPTPYILSTPIALAKGTQLSVIEYLRSGESLPAHALSVTLSLYEGAVLTTRQPTVAPASEHIQHFKLSGTVKSVDPADARVVVQHGEIPGFMGAMTMSYAVGESEDLKAIAAGDEIQSDVVVSEDSSHLENIKVVRHKQ